MKRNMFAFLLLIALVMTACTMLPTHKDDFTKKNDAFIQQIRWLKFAGAAPFFDEPLRAEFIERFENPDDLKIAGFSTTRVEATVPGQKVTVHYLLEYYRLPSVSVKKLRFPLEWELKSPESGESYWCIVNAFPEMP